MMWFLLGVLPSNISSDLDPLFIAVGTFAVGIVGFYRFYKALTDRHIGVGMAAFESVLVLILGAVLITVVSTLII